MHFSPRIRLVPNHDKESEFQGQGVRGQGLTSHPTQYRSFRAQPFQTECTQTHNNGTVSFTFTETQNTKRTS